MVVSKKKKKCFFFFCFRKHQKGSPLIHVSLSVDPSPLFSPWHWHKDILSHREGKETHYRGIQRKKENDVVIRITEFVLY